MSDKVKIVLEPAEIRAQLLLDGPALAAAIAIGKEMAEEASRQSEDNTGSRHRYATRTEKRKDRMGVIVYPLSDNAKADNSDHDTLAKVRRRVVRRHKEG